jgi:hypothetical protein
MNELKKYKITGDMNYFIDRILDGDVLDSNNTINIEGCNIAIGWVELEDDLIACKFSDNTIDSRLGYGDWIFYNISKYDFHEMLYEIIY